MLMHPSMSFTYTIQKEILKKMIVFFQQIQIRTSFPLSQSLISLALIMQSGTTMIQK